MTIDIIVVIALIAAIWKGWTSGILQALAAMLTVYIGLHLALKFSFVASEFLTKSLNLHQKMLPLFTFLLIFFLVAFVLGYVRKMVEKVLETINLNFLNRIAGAGLWFAAGVFAVSTIFWYLDVYGFLNKGTKEDSKTYALIRDISPQITNQTGRIIPHVLDVHQDIKTLISGMEVNEENHLQQPNSGTANAAVSE